MFTVHIFISDVLYEIVYDVYIITVNIVMENMILVKSFEKKDIRTIIIGTWSNIWHFELFKLKLIGNIRILVIYNLNGKN